MKTQPELPWRGLAKIAKKRPDGPIERLDILPLEDVPCHSLTGNCWCSPALLRVGDSKGFKHRKVPHLWDTLLQPVSISGPREDPILACSRCHVLCSSDNLDERCPGPDFSGGQNPRRT